MADQIATPLPTLPALPTPNYGDPVKDNSGNVVGSAKFDPNTGTALNPPPSSTGMDTNSYLNLMSTINGNLQQNNSLVEQKNLIQKHMFDSPLTADEMKKLPPEVQSIIQGGNQDQMRLQLKIINDTLQGRNDSVAKSIGFLTQGYLDHEKNVTASIQNLETYATNNGLKLGDLVGAMAPILGKDIAKQLQDNLAKINYPYIKSGLQAVTPGAMSLTDAISAQESGGSYTAVNSDSGALGKYQIMPVHLSDIGLNGNNPTDVHKFLNSPDLQDKLHTQIITTLTTRYNGDTDKILAAYYGGDYGASVVGTPAGDKPQGPNGKYPSVNAYVEQVKARMAQPSGQQFSAVKPTGDEANKVNPTTGLTGNGLYQAALGYLYEGKMPSLGLGSGATVKAARESIINTAGAIAADLGVDMPSLQALYKANSSAVKQNIERIARVETVTKALTLNTPRLKILADQVKAAGIDITESDVQAGSAAALRKFGSGPAASYLELIQTIRSDYSAAQAALAGSRGGTFFSDAANAAIPVGLTSDQYQQISDTILLSSQNAQTAVQDIVQGLLNSNSDTSTNDLASQVAAKGYNYAQMKNDGHSDAEIRSALGL